MHTWIDERSGRGYTLLELMVVIVVIGIFVAIAVPTYQHYVQETQRSAAESQMQSLAADLERWRGKNLSYENFTPTNCASQTNPNPVTCYTGTYANSSILLPIGSTSKNFTYQVLILDGACRSTLYPTTALAGCAGQSWVMIARPNTGDTTDTATNTGYMGSASRLVLDSQGVRCMTSGTLSDHISDATIGGTLPLTVAPTGAFTHSDAGLCSFNNTSVAWK